MEQHRVRRPRRAAAVFLAALTAMGLTAVPQAGAVEDVTTERIAGDDRFETAAEIAAEAFPTGSDTVLVASGRAFADALAGAALGFPILLTEQATLPAATAQAIDDLGATDAIILGGTARVSAAVEDEIATHATVDRIAGDDRYETAAEIATSIGTANVGEIDGMPTAIVATGLGFVDALAGGPLATGGDDSLPVLLVGDDYPASTKAAIETLGIEQVLIMGGTAVVSAATEAELVADTGNPAVRIAGNNRYETAVEAAEWAIDNLDFPAEEAILANSLEFADALAGGPLGGVRTAPILLTETLSLADESEEFFIDHSDTLETIDVVGGTAAVSQSSAESAETAAETPQEVATNEEITVSPKASADQANGSTREYTVTGIGTTVVDIALLDCSFVKTQSNGDTAFANNNLNVTADGAADNSGDAVDQADTPAFISSVNGEARQADDPTINNDYAAQVAPTNGSVTFVVTGPAGGTTSACIIPVVFGDENNDVGLTTPQTNPAVPSEPFGTGGATNFSPNGFGGSTFNVNVDSNSENTNRFVGCTISTDNAATGEVTDPRACSTFNYDDNDTFQLNGGASTLAAFEALLTSGDDVRGTYSATAATRSVFNLYADEAPEPPTIDPNPGNPTVTSNSVSIDFFESSRSTVEHYRLYRAAKPVAIPPATTSTCPTFASGSYTMLTGSTVDDKNPAAQPNTTSHLTIADTTAQPGTTYCYYLISEDDGDEGPPSDLVPATTGTGADTTTPHLVTAVGHAGSTNLSAGDTHVFTFNEPMDQASIFGSSYRVVHGGTSATITCGGTNPCELDGTAKVITIHIGAAGLPGSQPAYDLTIDRISGFTDAAGNPITMFEVDDLTIESAPTT